MPADGAGDAGAAGRSQDVSAPPLPTTAVVAEASQGGKDGTGPLLGILRDLLVSLRSDAGLTQQELAARIGYSRAAVGGAESLKRIPADFPSTVTLSR